jgi:hypothetical protein
MARQFKTIDKDKYRQFLDFIFQETKSFYKEMPLNKAVKNFKVNSRTGYALTKLGWLDVRKDGVYRSYRWALTGAPTSREVEVLTKELYALAKAARGESTEKIKRQPQVQEKLPVVGQTLLRYKQFLDDVYTTYNNENPESITAICSRHSVSKSIPKILVSNGWIRKLKQDSKTVYLWNLGEVTYQVAEELIHLVNEGVNPDYVRQSREFKNFSAEGSTNGIHKAHNKKRKEGIKLEITPSEEVVVQQIVTGVQETKNPILEKFLKEVARRVDAVEYLLDMGEDEVAKRILAKPIVGE